MTTATPTLVKTNQRVYDYLHKILPGNDPDRIAETEKSLLAEYLYADVDVLTVFLGMATCGIGAGAESTRASIQSSLSEHGVAFRIVEVGCIGLCALEPLMDIQVPGKPRVSFSNVTSDNAQEILNQFLKGEYSPDHLLGQFRSSTLDPWPSLPYIDEHPFFAPQTRLVLKNCGLIDPRSIEQYIALQGYQAFIKTIHSRTPNEVSDMILASGLRGRGGGGFPTGRKWQFAQKSQGDQKYLICNADEGDPGAFMDRAVIEGDPHRLLEGMAIGAYTIGATKAYIYIRAEYPLAISRLEEAIDQARAYGLIGENIMDTGFNLDIIIKKGAGAFVCGEETALMASIEGKRGMPRPRPPYPTDSGLFGKPTVINNVETLANIPGIVLHGPEKFAALGTKNSRGTKVFAVSGKVTYTGLVEVEMGKTLRSIVFDIGGGIPNGRAYKAVQIGGPSGGCIPEQHLDIPIDYDSLIEVGAMMGSGGLVVMDEDNCMVDIAKFFMRFIQRESCGKCIPCREGTRRMLEILERITRGHRAETGTDALVRFQGVLSLTRLAEVIRSTSLCGLGQTAPNPVLSTLRWFKDEYDAHIYERRCPAGACKELLKYVIDINKCVGCTLCAKKCPANAIMGAPKSPHYIVEERCIGCGACLEICKFKAVYTE
jgi:NADH:ubiquinone oxidoreductase subunit F (NADH-binding)/Pyruvate/2-oxoacid:ferredoxin oxidoreductase delta subunit/(2Fe-2S) ferredoxin